MKVTGKQLALIEKLKEEELSWTIANYYRDEEVVYSIEEGQADDEVEFKVELEDRYKKLVLIFRVTDEKIDIHVYEDQYEELSTTNIWKILFLTTRCS